MSACTVTRSGITASEEALTVHHPMATQAMVHSTAGLCHFIMGHPDLADEHLGLAEALEDRGVDSPEPLEPWVENMLVSAPTIRAGAAVMVEDWAAADQHVARARNLAGTSANELVLVEYHAAWRAAQQGDAALARERANVTLGLIEQLGDSFYAPMSRVVLGWATAMLGDASAVRLAEEACADCARIGMRFQETVHLMLCAEAHAEHGDLAEATAFVQRWRAAAVALHERTVGRRLLARAFEIAGPE